jgi:hypothetical protein
MTEQEWLACDDPKQLLDYLTGNMPEKLYDRHPSQRKLRLWVEACRKVFSSREGVLTIWRDLKEFPGELQECLATWGSELRSRLFPLAERAHLLRDIVGNPWRPVELPLNVKCPGCDGKGGWPSTAGKHGGPGGQTVTACRRCDGEGRLCPWLTLTVVSLAHAAYDHRDPTTGHLDPVRLAVLADALTDAGCDAYGPVVWHLRGRDDLGWHVLNHPHVRGCHVIDRLLGKEWP